MIKTHSSVSRAAVLAALLMAAALPGRAATPLPVRELAPHELGSLNGMPYSHPANHSFQMAAAVAVSALGRGSPQTQVQRSNGAQAAVYRGLPVKNPAPALLPPAPPTEALFDFIETGDHAQGWATMTASAVPHLWVRGYGGFTIDATASWTTALTVPAGGSREVVVRFVVPQAAVSGATEQDGISRWRAKLRAELLVNGFPAWSSESLRMTVEPKIVAGYLQETVVLQQFGSPLGFATNDEDALPDNNSNVGNVGVPSSARTVYLTLGRFNSGQVIDLSMIHRATAMTAPSVEGGAAPACTWKVVPARYFCSRGSASLDGSSGQAPRIYFLP